MNDPMEGYYLPSARLKKEPEWRQTYRSILEAKRATGISCFSEMFNNEIMWAHYADNFRGICLGYSAAKLRDNLPPSARLSRIAYADAPLRLSKHERSNVIAAAQKILSQKKYNWSYEREWRVLADYPGQLPYQGDIITEVYFGFRISEDHKQAILSGMGARGINFKQMKIAGYSHTPAKIVTPKLVRYL